MICISCKDSTVVLQSPNNLDHFISEKCKCGFNYQLSYDYSSISLMKNGAFVFRWEFFCTNNVTSFTLWSPTDFKIYDFDGFIPFHKAKEKATIRQLMA